MRLGIFGYGNLGKMVEANACYFDDIELAGIFTRRNPQEVQSLGTSVYSADDLLKFKDKIDVLFIAGGSSNDLPVLTPELAKSFNVIDSFDNHSKMLEHFNNVDKNAIESDHLAIIAAGWDPGLFSVQRILFDSIMPNGKTYTFWGRGVSQGHSNAIRKIDGVADARQYTIPKPDALAEVRAGKNVDLNSKTMHIRECFVVVKDGADKSKIENQIKTMPGYFEGYQTVVHFISQQELDKNHSGLPHGGMVIRNANGKTECHKIDFSLDLGSNPEFTSSVILAYSRALFSLYKEGKRGCLTVADIAPKYLSEFTKEDLITRYV